MGAPPLFFLLLPHRTRASSLPLLFPGPAPSSCLFPRRCHRYRSSSLPGSGFISSGVLPALHICRSLFPHLLDRPSSITGPDRGTPTKGSCLLLVRCTHVHISLLACLSVRARCRGLSSIGVRVWSDPAGRVLDATTGERNMGARTDKGPRIRCCHNHRPSARLPCPSPAELEGTYVRTVRTYFFGSVPGGGRVSQRSRSRQTERKSRQPAQQPQGAHGSCTRPSPNHHCRPHLGSCPSTELSRIQSPDAGVCWSPPSARVGVERVNKANALGGVASTYTQTYWTVLQDVCTAAKKVNGQTLHTYSPRSSGATQKGRLESRPRLSVVRRG